MNGFYRAIRDTRVYLVQTYDQSDRSEIRESGFCYVMGKKGWWEIKPIDRLSRFAQNWVQARVNVAHERGWVCIMARDGTEMIALRCSDWYLTIDD